MTVSRFSSETVPSSPGASVPAEASFASHSVIVDCKQPTVVLETIVGCLRFVHWALCVDALSVDALSEDVHS